MKKQTGFSLIELIVVVTIVGLFGVFLTDILAQVLRGENKVRILSQVKQNGQTILDKLTDELRQAESTTCTGNTIVIKGSGGYRRYQLTDGVIRWDVSNSDLNCTDTVSSSNILTNNDAIKGVKIINDGEYLLFERKNDSIIIRFRIEAASGAGSAYESLVQQGGVPFSTSVQLRNIRR